MKVISSRQENRNNRSLKSYSHALFFIVISGLHASPERYCRLFGIKPGQLIHLGKNLPDAWKYQLRDFQVLTGKVTAHCDFLIESNAHKSLQLIKSGELSKMLSSNGSALLQVSKGPGRLLRWTHKIKGLPLVKVSNNAIRVTLPNNSEALYYFAVGIIPGFEEPNEIILLPSTTKSGKLQITRQKTDFSGSIAVLTTTRDTPFPSLLSDLPENLAPTPRKSPYRIVFRERGTVIVEFNATNDKPYIARISLTDKNNKNIIKNYTVIQKLHANSALPSSVKQLIPTPIAVSENSSIEDKKPGQLAWEIARDKPELEQSILNQVWDFSFALSSGTCRELTLDGEGFDSLIGDDLKYIQYYCSNDNLISKLLGLIDQYLRGLLLGKEVLVAVCHGDLGYGNILCDGETGNLSGVFDWDTSRDTELPGVDFINLLIQKFRSHSRMDESYKAALDWLGSDEALQAKIRTQLHERFGISDEDLKVYHIISALHLMGRDFRFHKPGNLRPEERDTIILLASSIKQHHSG